MTTATNSWVYGAASSAALNFSAVTVTETDNDPAGNLTNIGSFTGNGAVTPAEQVGAITTASGYQGLSWSSFNAGAFAPGDTVTITFSYTVSSGVAGQGISSAQQAFTIDYNPIPGATLLQSVETVSSGGTVVGQSTINTTTQNSAFALTGSYSSVQVNVSLTFSVASTATTAAGIDFSYLDQGFATSALPATGSIGNFVWNDLNGDGIYETGEAGVSGITVDLLNGSGTIVGVTTTDATGHYLFSGLNAGSYQVAFVAPLGYSFTSQVAGNGSQIVSAANVSTGKTAVVNLAAGQNITLEDAGLVMGSSGGGGGGATGAITTHVYLDTNGDGTQGAGESNLAGVTVALLNASGVPTGTTAVTDPSGNVSFAGLAPGSYQVAVVTPAGDLVSQSTNVGTPLTVVANQTVAAIEGVYAPATFTTHVYLDGNGDGTQSGVAETNLAGVTVALLNSNGVATGQTAVTNSAGNVSFTGLVPGGYQVAVTAPAGDVVTQNTNTLTTNVLASGQTATAIEGVYAPATFTTHVYLDSNADGTQGVGESNLAGVTVQLLNGSGVAITGKTAVTDANGNVSFAGLAPGSYEVAVTTPTGDLVKQATNIMTPTTLVSGQTATAIEGVYAPATFTTHVYLDGNADGVQGVGESNLAGVTVVLLNGSGVPTGQTLVTDANGNVSFAGLAPGSYEVAVTTPTGDLVKQTTNIMTPTTLVSGQTATAIEGVYAPAAFTTHVFFSAAGDTVQGAGDSNLAGVTVALLNGSGVATGQTATTDANGNVSFTGLTPGSYEVAVTTPTGDTVTKATNVATPTTLLSGQIGTAIEGLTKPTGLATFTTHVFYDTNKDGVQTAGETNLAGVTVQLLTGLGASTGKTAITDANGNVSFTGLNAGTYEVAVVTPTGDAVTKATNVGTPTTLAAGGSAYAIEGVVAKGASITVDKSASVTATKAGACVTYTYKVTNTGTQALDNIKVVDNRGTALNPINVTASAVTGNSNCSVANIGDSNANGLLDVGETWTYQSKVTENGCILGTNSCSAVTTITGCNTHGGETLWVNSQLHDYSNSDGTCYSFRGLTANISCADGSKHSYAVADCDVKFSSSCRTPTTTWDTGRNCWVTTVPSGSNLGNVFASGCAINVPTGCNMQGATMSMSVAACTGSTGAKTPSWQVGCSAYDNFNTSSGDDASADYSKIGVKSCDNRSDGYCGDSSDKAGTAGNCENNYTAPGWQQSYGWNCGWGGWNWGCTGYSYSDGSGNCGTSGSSGYSGSTCVTVGQCADTSVMDRVTVTAQTYCANATGNYCSGTEYDPVGNQYVCGSYGSGSSNSGWSDNNSNCSSSYSCGTSYGGTATNCYTNAYDGSQCATVGTNNVCLSGDRSGLVWDYSDACWKQPTATNVNSTTGCGTSGNGCTVTTVTASDMANVQVLNTTNIQLGGTAPTGELKAAFGAATKLEFTYAPSDVVSATNLQNGVAVANGHNASSLAFIEVTNSANPFATGASVYFAGTASTGSKFIADATVDINNNLIPGGTFSSVAGQDLYAFVFADQNSFNAHAAPMQTIVYDTTGANGGMHINDQIGSIKLAGYVGTTGHGYLVA